MTLLVHVDYGGGSAFPTVAVGTRIDIWNGSRIIHAEIATDIHTAIGGDMVFEVAVRNQNAAKHGCGRVVIGGLGLLITVKLACAFVGNATVDGYLSGLLEIPHDLLGGSRIKILLIIFSSLGVAIADFSTVPPESPAIVEIDIGSTDIHHDRSIIRDISEREINASIARRRKLRGSDVEDLHGRALAAGISITFESDELFSVVGILHARELECVRNLVFTSSS